MLEIIQVGHDPASDRYVRNKISRVNKDGMQAVLSDFPDTVDTYDIVMAVKLSDADAIMVQLPLPEHIDKDAVIKAIPPEKDIDGLNPYSDYQPLTPCAIMRWLDENGTELEGKEVVVLGRSNLVGLPLVNLLIKAGATVTCCNSHTGFVASIRATQNADIVISAIGEPNIIDYTYISPWHKQIWIDVGISVDSNGKLCGDVSSYAREAIERLGGFCSPVPGGVGQWTQRELAIRQAEMEKR